MNFILNSLLVISCLCLLQAEGTAKAQNGRFTGKCGTGDRNHSEVQVWITDPLKNILFRKSSEKIHFGEAAPSSIRIEIDSSLTFQTIDGFGACLTGGSAMLINRMDRAGRAKLLRELFSAEGPGIGISYLRISIGASDLNDCVYSYDDIPEGTTDPELEHFSISMEKQDLIPVLKEILKINPGLKIMGSPWSAPVWMKTNGNSKGGSLKQEWYGAYAKYFVMYIKAMQEEGIAIDAITVQNEPLHPGNNPSMYMTAEEQAAFIGSWLGPEFKRERIDTKIIVYDHNANRPDYPLTIYRDPLAYPFVDGAAFHLYEGPMDTLDAVHNAFPEKNLYFTEQWVGAPGNLAEDLKWHLATLVIGGTRNWCRTVLEWNLAADAVYEPHTEGGCTACLGAVTIDKKKVTRNPAWYVLAHSSKFVRPGAIRLASSQTEQLSDVAFRNSDGSYVLIVVNNSDEQALFNISFNGIPAAAQLGGGASATYVWR